MGRTDQLAVDLPHADPDAAIRRQIAVALRHHHRHAPAGVVGNYRVWESGIEHLGPFARAQNLAAARIVSVISQLSPQQGGTAPTSTAFIPNE
jgi:hypothetical protein